MAVSVRAMVKALEKKTGGKSDAVEKSAAKIKVEGKKHAFLPLDFTNAAKKAKEEMKKRGFLPLDFADSSDDDPESSDDFCCCEACFGTLDDGQETSEMPDAGSVRDLVRLWENKKHVAKPMHQKP